MYKISAFFRVLCNFFYMAPILLFFRPAKDHDKISLGLMFQRTAARHADKSAIIFEGTALNWRQYNELANQFAHLLKQQGVQRGDTVAVMMENRIELLCCIVALSKLGATAGLINTNLTNQPLAHCITTVDSKKCLFGEEVSQAIFAIQDQLTLNKTDYLWVADSARGGCCPDWACDASALLEAMPACNLPETEDIRAREKACYIFTSGTTGLPKPAVISHRRYLTASIPFAKIGFRAKSSDRMYVCLPLYHITGLGPGVGSCFYSGASIFLRRRFSARSFWPEVQQYQTNLFVYVGELCRYLAMQPACPEEHNNPIETMLGNGLRPDIWDLFRQRFNIQRISEMYGSSEGNVSLINVLNKDHTIGTSSAQLMLVKYDVDSEEIVRDSQGKIIEVAVGEPGLFIAKIDDKYKFDGYRNKQASDSKILTDVRRPGDRWFNTGDLIRQIDVGFAMGLRHFQFVDRTGDTFRWRAENVSTNEVGEILNACEQVEISNVYGVEVPGAEGKAGMATITLKGGLVFDPVTFSQFVDRELTSCARPVFIRLEKEQPTTVTFKLFKGQLKKQAYHLEQIDSPIYVRKPKSKQYELLDQPFYQQILDATSGY